MSSPIMDRLKASWGALPRPLQAMIAISVAFWALRVVLPSTLSTSILRTLNWNTDALLSGQVWRLFTHSFVRPAVDLFGLFFDVMLLWMLGGLFSRRWRSTHFMFFSGICALVGAMVAGALSLLAPAWFSPVFYGMSSVILGYFAAFLMIFGRERVLLFGMSAPVLGKWVVYVLLGLQTLFFLAGVNPLFGMQLGGFLAGWLLVTGRWRPQKFGDWVKVRTEQRRWEKKRKHLKIVH